VAINDQADDERLLSGRVARGTVSLGLRALAGYVVSAVTMLVLTHKLTAGQFGVYSVLVAGSLIAYQLITSGFATAFSRSDAEVDAEVINAAFWGFELVYGLVAAVLVAVSFLVSSSAAHIILRGMAGFLLIAPLRFPMVVRCWRRLEMGRLALIDLAEFSVLQFGSLALVLAGVGAESFGYAIVGAVITSSVVSMTVMRWYPTRPSLAALRPWLAEVRPLFLAGGLGLIRDNGGAPLLSVVFGTAVAGYYGWALGVSVAVLALVSVSSHSLQLGFMRVKDRERTVDALRRSLRILLLLIGAVVAVIGGAGRPITAVIFTSRWLPALLGMRFLLAAVGLLTILNIFVSLAVADRRVATVNRLLVAVCGLTVVLGLPAAHYWGMQGYAGAMLFSTVVVLACAWRLTEQIYGIGRSEAYFAVEVALSAGVSVLVGAFAFASAGGWLRLCEACLVSGGVFALAMLVIARALTCGAVSDVVSLLTAG
jgi:O-antigen/teichoic acid export membrane protein